MFYCRLVLQYLLLTVVTVLVVLAYHVSYCHCCRWREAYKLHSNIVKCNNVIVITIIVPKMDGECVVVVTSQPFWRQFCIYLLRNS